MSNYNPHPSQQDPNAPQPAYPQQGYAPPPGGYAPPSGPPPVPGNRPVSSHYAPSPPTNYGQGQQQPYGQYNTPPPQGYNNQQPPFQPPPGPPPVQQPYGYNPGAPYATPQGPPPPVNYGQQPQYGAPPGPPPPQQQYGYSPGAPQQPYNPPSGPPPPQQYNTHPPAPSGYPAPPVPNAGYPPPAVPPPSAYPAGPAAMSMPQATSNSGGFVVPPGPGQIPARIPGQLTYLGTPIPNPNSLEAPVLPTYNPDGDVQRLVKATKGFGTDELALIDVLTRLDAFEMDALNRAFKGTTGKSLVSVIQKETKSWFCMGLVGLATGPLAWDVELLNKAMVGAGTDKVVLNEILLSRTNEEIALLKAAYQHRYNRTLESHVKSELSGNVERLFMMVLAGTRASDWDPVIPEKAKEDARALYLAGQARTGTDEMAFCRILANRSGPQLNAIAIAYQDEYAKKLTRIIEKEFSGHLETALVYIAEGTGHVGQGEQYRTADLLEKAMAGMGTKDEWLVRRIVRAHWDRVRFSQVKEAYKKQYLKSLYDRVKGETSGDYQRLMLRLVGKEDLRM